MMPRTFADSFVIALQSSTAGVVKGRVASALTAPLRLEEETVTEELDHLHLTHPRFIIHFQRHFLNDDWEATARTHMTALKAATH